MRVEGSEVCVLGNTDRGCTKFGGDESLELADADAVRIASNWVLAGPRPLDFEQGSIGRTPRSAESAHVLRGRMMER